MCRQEILNDIKMQLAFLSGNMDRITSEIKELEEILNGFPMKLGCWTYVIKINDHFSFRIGFDRLDYKWGIVIKEYDKSQVTPVNEKFLLNASIGLRILGVKYLDMLLDKYINVINDTVELLTIDKLPINCD